MIERRYKRLRNLLCFNCARNATHLFVIINLKYEPKKKEHEESKRKSFGGCSFRAFQAKRWNPNSRRLQTKKDLINLLDGPSKKCWSKRFWKREWERMPHRRGWMGIVNLVKLLIVLSCTVKLHLSRDTDCVNPTKTACEPMTACSHIVFPLKHFTSSTTTTD